MVDCRAYGRSIHAHRGSAKRNLAIGHGIRIFAKINRCWHDSPAGKRFSKRVLIKKIPSSDPSKRRANNEGIIGQADFNPELFQLASKPIEEHAMPKHAVLRALNPVAFFREVQESRRHVVNLCCGESFHPLSHRNAEIFLAVDHQQWRLPVLHETVW